MANITLIKGQVYRIRLTDGRWTDGAFLFEKRGYSSNYGYHSTRTNTHFMFRNLKTGREIEIKSMQRVKETTHRFTDAGVIFDQVRSPVLDRDDTCVLCDAGEVHEH